LWFTGRFPHRFTKRFTHGFARWSRSTRYDRARWRRRYRAWFHDLGCDLDHRCGWSLHDLDGFHLGFRVFLGNSLFRRSFLDGVIALCPETIGVDLRGGCLLRRCLLGRLGLLGLLITNQTESLGFALEHRHESLDECGLRGFRRHVVVFAEIQQLGIGHTEFLC